MKEVYTTLFQRILQGFYPPDTWLREDALSEEFGISRTPIREFLRQLERGFLVQLIPNRGAKVLPFTADDVEDLYEIRKSLEILALKYAAPVMGIQGLMDLRAMVVDCARSDDAARNTEVDLNLHNYFIEASRRRRIILTLEQQLVLLKFFREMGFSHKEERASTVTEHLEFIDALCVRDLKKAIEILGRHIDNSKTRALSKLAKNGFGRSPVPVPKKQ